MLQEIRFILNIHSNSTSPISCVLIGQPELGGKLKMRTFEALVQRVQVRQYLCGLLPDEDERAASGW